jgi:hypothetical protein
MISVVFGVDSGLRRRKADAASKLSLWSVLALIVVVCAAVGVQDVRAGPLGPVGYTPTLYVFQNNELIDVKTFKIADLEQCQRRASALLQLYLNHSDIEDNMSLVVRCVPVPPASVAHRKGEQAT